MTQATHKVSCISGRVCSDWVLRNCHDMLSAYAQRTCRRKSMWVSGEVVAGKALSHTMKCNPFMVICNVHNINSPAVFILSVVRGTVVAGSVYRRH